MVDKRRIGIIGGTFNPIHLGHLMIAEVACESFNLEKVIFVPARIPPHKQHDVIDSHHRYAWKFIDEIIDEVHFIGATRPDGSSAIDSTLDELGSKAREKIHVMEVPEMNLSATYLRERLRSGKTVRYMLPKCVVDYIEENHIYGKE